MWTIWYKKDTVHGESVEEWSSLPDEGVVAIYQYEGRGEDGVMRGKIFLGTDWYWMLPTGEIGQNSETTDTKNYWVDVELPEGAMPKKGIWVTDKKMKQVETELIKIIEG